MTKRKTSPFVLGDDVLSPQEIERTRPGLEDFAAKLRALDVDPTAVLARALYGETLARKAGGDPLKALRENEDALFSPTVTLALRDASRACRSLTWRQAWRRLEDGREIPVHFEPVGAKPIRFLTDATRALTRAPEWFEEHARFAEALGLAWEIEARVNVDGWTRKAAKARVAAAHGIGVAGLEKKIYLARKAHPLEPWPKKTAGRL